MNLKSKLKRKKFNKLFDNLKKSYTIKSQSLKIDDFFCTRILFLTIQQMDTYSIFFVNDN